jgi:hypothetical protein
MKILSAVRNRQNIVPHALDIYAEFQGVSPFRESNIVGGLNGSPVERYSEGFRAAGKNVSPGTIIAAAFRPGTVPKDASETSGFPPGRLTRGCYYAVYAEVKRIQALGLNAIFMQAKTCRRESYPDLLLFSSSDVALFRCQTCTCRQVRPSLKVCDRP